MMSRLIIFFLFLSTSFSFAQSYDNDLLPATFHKNRRDALRALLKDSSVAVFFANPVRNRANDVDFQYHQDPNFYYLTGLKETDAVLLVFKEEFIFKGQKTNELIFVAPKNPKYELWNGKRLGIDGVNKKLGFNSVYANTEFTDFDCKLSKLNLVYAINKPIDFTDNEEDAGDLFSIKKALDKKVADAKIKTKSFELEIMMDILREIKQPEELVLLKKAIDISCKAHIELMKTLEPGMHEYQAQAVVEYFFKNQGSEYTGYPSIVGGGENACVLHYNTNRKQLNGEELLVVDAGAEYHGYTADITRTLPVDGKFSEQELIIYNIVLEAQTAGIKACKAGNKFWDPHSATTKIIKKRLREIGLIKKDEDFQKYFMHGTSHYLGLDVHDAGTFNTLRPNTVITVEPGIYIPEGSDCDKKWWNIGVRIEDDILITETEPINLSVSVPRLAKEVEEMMKQKSLLNEIK
ncbi:MAG: aminopeptidase P family protein [Bacteroidota bacterium]